MTNHQQRESRLCFGQQDLTMQRAGHDVRPTRRLESCHGRRGCQGCDQRRASDAMMGCRLYDRFRRRELLYSTRLRSLRPEPATATGRTVLVAAFSGHFAGLGLVFTVEEFRHAGLVKDRGKCISDDFCNREHLDLVELLLSRQGQCVCENNS